MDKSTPLQILRRLGYNGDDLIALLLPILLGKISTDLLLSCEPTGGNDLLAYRNLAPKMRYRLGVGLNENKPQIQQ